MSDDEHTDQTRIIPPITLPIREQRPHRHDTFRLVIALDALAVFAMCSLWAVGTSHDWLRLLLTPIALAGLVHFAVYLATRHR